ncbi:MAG: hypothetical protein EPO45_05465 [Sphingobium sp.]|jgi:hypothetical protein|uniref:hypothetical protein n=1 Tax=Sphingobium sp. TaxID=1912891 RepID=UPI000C565EDE|nr:hypothetical protein [Sphingobium sp.]MBU0657355.1 hypothetical protein [Alphaproteobacteria bacterium]MBA4754146.1 hypothetical protein [Sphingobium sp.]MBS89046.1 hypothetical protein [Sphingobium sp.]MBU0775912.1 hypothetical protein [Alphaproteobacteria bacterium]MBU1258550.1 hypothetical protein [Alphaproteobacteria bacterium]
MSDKPESESTKDAAGRVLAAFLIYDLTETLLPLTKVSVECPHAKALLKDAIDGLRSVVSAGTLPYHLVYRSVHQRHFDKILTAERIRSLKSVNYGEDPSDEVRSEAYRIAQARMREFFNSEEGMQAYRDRVVDDLDNSLCHMDVAVGASELLVQTLISTWSVFESAARAFIISWVNADPARAKPLLDSNELKTYFGKQVVGLEVISDFGFNLSASMGDVLFLNKRLDNLGVVRAILGAFFNDEDIRNGLGEVIWMLNQRRHLFVHRRGIVDAEYISRTGDSVALGERLPLRSDDVASYISAVQTAVVAIAVAVDRSSA